MEDDELKSIAKRSERVKSIFDSDDSDDEEDSNDFHFSKAESSTSKQANDVVFSYDKSEASLSAEILDTHSVSSNQSAVSEEIPLQDPSMVIPPKHSDQTDEHEFEPTLNREVEVKAKEASSPISSIEDGNSETQIATPTTEPQSNFGLGSSLQTSYEDDLNVSSDNDDAEDSRNRISPQEYSVKNREMEETEDCVDAFDRMKGTTCKEHSPKVNVVSSDFESRLNADLLVSSDDDDEDTGNDNQETSSDLTEPKKIESPLQDVTPCMTTEPTAGSNFQDVNADEKLQSNANDEGEGSDSNMEPPIQQVDTLEETDIDAKSSIHDDDNWKETDQMVKSPFQEVEESKDKGVETFFLEKKRECVNEDLSSSGQSTSSSYEHLERNWEGEEEKDEHVMDAEGALNPDQKVTTMDDRLHPSSFAAPQLDDESNSVKFTFNTKDNDSDEVSEDGEKGNESLEVFSDEADQFLKDDISEERNTCHQIVQKEDGEMPSEKNFQDETKFDSASKGVDISQKAATGVIENFTNTDDSENKDAYFEKEHMMEVKDDEETNVSDESDKSSDEATDGDQLDDSSMECDSNLFDSSQETHTLDLGASKNLEAISMDGDTSEFNNVSSLKIKIRNNKIVDVSSKDFHEKSIIHSEELGEDSKVHNDNKDVDVASPISAGGVAHLETTEEEANAAQSIKSDSGLEDNYDSAKVESTEPTQNLASEGEEVSQRSTETPDGSVTLPLNFQLADPPPQSLAADKKTKIRVEDIFTDSEVEDFAADEAKPVNGHNAQHPPQDFEASRLKKNVKRSISTSINMPAIITAFHQGWVRELVHRSSASSRIQRADVYYRAPSGKKLRSKVEIEDYLQKNNITDLTLKNFTFFKEALGVDSAYEKIRHAVPSRSNTPPLNEVVDTVKSVFPKRSFSDVLPEQRSQSNAASSAKKSRVEKVPKPPKDVQYLGSKIPLVKKQTSGNVHRAAVYATHLFTCSPPLMQPKIITPLIRKDMREKTLLCTANCDAGGGRVPNLQCVKCLCLFHSDCCLMPPATVTIILASMAKFLCPNCYREESEVSYNRAVAKAPTCYEPLSYDPPEDSEDEGLCSDIDDGPIREVTLRPKTPPPSFLKFGSHTKSLPPKQLISSIPQSVPQPNQNLGSMTSATFPGQNYMLGPSGEQPHKGQGAAGQPQYYLIYNQGGQPPLLLPTSMPPGIKANAQPYLTPILPADASKYSTPLQPINLPNNFANDLLPDVASTNNAYPAVIAKSPVEQSLPPVPKLIAAARGGIYFLEDMAKTYRVMKRIFSYLSVADLLVVSRVCVMWKDLALNPCYWRTVHLRNVCVKDWNKLVEFLDRRGTQELDLRKMVIFAGLHDPSEKDSEVVAEEFNEGDQVMEEEELKEESPPQDAEADDKKDSAEPHHEKEEEKLALENKPEEPLKELETEKLIDEKDNEEREIEGDKNLEITPNKDEEDHTDKLSPPHLPPLSPPKEIKNQVSETLLAKDDILGDEAPRILTEEVDLESTLDVCIPPSSEEVNASNNEIGDKYGSTIPRKVDSRGGASERDDSGDPVPIPQTPEEIESYERFLYTQRIASSVLSEHDYFGKSMTEESSSDSSSESSSDSSTSDSDSEGSDNDPLPPHRVMQGKDLHESLKDEMVAVMNMDIPKAEYDPNSYEEEAPQKASANSLPKKRKNVKIPPQSTRFKKLKTSESNIGKSDASPPILSVTSNSTEGHPPHASPKDVLEVEPLKQQEEAKLPQDSAAPAASGLPTSPSQSQATLHSEKEQGQKHDLTRPSEDKIKTTPIIKMPNKTRELAVHKPRPIQQLEKIPKKNDSNRAWHIIGSALKNLQMLRKLVVGTCDPDIVEIIVYYCHQLTSFTALSLSSRSGLDIASFDPSFLMHSRKLQELRLASQKNFNLLSNFNFIRLPSLKILMLKGLKTSNVGWPYLGTNLTHLYLSSVSTFSLNNWKNLSAMSNLMTLELEGGGADHDADLSTSLSALHKLKYLSLFDWHIGPKLPSALKRLHNIHYLYIIPAVENQNLRGVYAGRLVVIMEVMKQHLKEFSWGILPSSLTSQFDMDKIYLLSMKANKDSTAAEDEPKLLSLDNLRSYVEKRVPLLTVQIKKVSEASWTWGTNGEWR